ncbi:hypothetical protein [Senegalia massiliensis]|uniref:hypothetical protein n=1 Tax=Senegalia massiliensis TaxID=1720316 RepID=UPI001030456D|nr:hypothetical protein [Senegalia massiliensis]
MSIIAKNIKGITIQIGAETTGLDKALQNVNKQSRDIAKELRQVNKGLKFNPKDTTLLAQKQELLGNQVNTTKEKLEKLKSAQQEVSNQYKNGEIDDGQYRAFQREIVETESKLGHYENQLKEVEQAQKRTGDTAAKASKKLKDMGSKLKGIGQSMTTKVTLPLVGGFAAVTKGTEEFRGDLAKLETNAKNAGIGTDKIKKSLVDLSAVSDETDSNVEALSNLLATGFDEQGMTQAMDALSGAVIKFPDTLKIEGLADGLQETLATGKAVGPFAEMLERSGMNLDTFNEGLAEAKKKGEEQNYILQTLADTGLAKVNEEYRKNNKELVENKESQQEFQNSMATLGETLQPIMTKVTQGITKVVTSFNNMSPAAQKVILVIAAIAAAIGPLLMVIGTLATGLSSVIGLFGGGAAAGAGGGGLAAAFTAITGPVGIVIAVITGLIAIFVALYKNNEDFRIKVQEVWTKVKEIIGVTIEGLKAIITVFIETSKAIWNKYGTDIITILTKAFTVISNVVTTVLNIIKGIIKVVLAVIKGDWQGAWDAIKGLLKDTWNGIKSIITSSISLVKSILSTYLKVITGLMGKAWDVIKSVAKFAWDKIKSNIINPISSAKDRVFSTINAMKNDAISKFESLRSSAKSKFDAAKSAIVDPIESAKNTISNIVEKIKGFFSGMKLKIPKPSIPKMSISKGFKKVFGYEVPYPKISWNAQGGILKRPTIIPTMAGLQGFAEPRTGGEAIMPLNKLPSLMAKALEKIGGIGSTIVVKQMIVREEADIDRVARKLDDMRRRGGRK